MSLDDSRVDRRDLLKYAGAASAAVLAGCTGDGGSGGDGGDGGSGSDGGDGSDGGSTDQSSGDWPDLNGTEVHIIIDETSDPVKNFWNGVTSDFEDATNAKTNVEFVGRNIGGVERVTQLLQAGDPPELFAMNQNNATAFELQDVIEPVTDLMKDIESRLGEPNKKVEFKGEQWLIPGFFNVTAWYWRGDIAEDIGMDSRPEWTWETALEFARGADDVEGIRGTYVPAGSGPHLVSSVASWVNTIDGSFVHWEDDKIAVNFDEGSNRDKMIEVLNFLDDMHEYSPVASDSGYGSWARAVSSGSTASGNYIGYRPKMYAVRDERPYAGDIHAGMMPKKKSRTTDGNVDGYGIFKGSNVDAAKTFMRFYTQIEQMVELYKINPVHDIPPYPNVRESDAYTNFLDGLSGAWTPEDTRAYQKRVVNNLEISINQTDPPNPYSGTIAGADPIPNLVKAVLIDDKNPDDVIDKHASDLQQILDDAQS